MLYVINYRGIIFSLMWHPSFLDLSFQAAQRVKSASSLDSLKVLKDISQNVPMLARYILLFILIFLQNCELIYLYIYCFIY